MDLFETENISFSESLNIFHFLLRNWINAASIRDGLVSFYRQKWALGDNMIADFFSSYSSFCSVSDI